MTFITVLMIYNIHFTVVVYPQFTNNYIVYSCRNFPPCIVVTTFRKFCMRNSWKIFDKHVHKFLVLRSGYRFYSNISFFLTEYFYSFKASVFEKQYHIVWLFHINSVVNGHVKLVLECIKYINNKWPRK